MILKSALLYEYTKLCLSCVQCEQNQALQPNTAELLNSIGKIDVLVLITCTEMAEKLIQLTKILYERHFSESVAPVTSKLTVWDRLTCHGILFYNLMEEPTA